VIAADNTRLLEGARVQIKALNRSAATSRDGRFSFGNVPAGTYEVTVDWLGAATRTESVSVQDGLTVRLDIAVGGELDEIVVRGQRAGTSRALNQQRTSDTFSSVVSAEDIGALPDANVAEAVQRVPGVFLERDQGEGRYIGVRGIDPNYNVTMINGLFVPSPDAGARSVALDVIPSDLLEGLEVSKTFTPDMEASAIGGIVNVRSLSAFDREGRSFTVAAEGSYSDLVEETSPKVSGSYSNIFSLGSGTDNVGVALAASWFDRDFGSDNIESGGWPNDLETTGGTVFKGADEIEQRSYTVNRERLGLALNFDTRTSNGTYYWRNLYSEFSDQEYRMTNVFVFDDGDALSGSDTSAQWQGATIEKEMKDRLEEQTILSVLLGGENYLDKWTLDYSYGYSHGEETEPDRLDTLFVYEGVDIGYSSIGDIPILTADQSATVPDNYGISEFVYLDGLAEDEAHNVKLNFTYDLFSKAYNGNIKFGAAYRTRDKDYDATEITYEDPSEPALAPFANAGPRYSIGSPFGPGINEQAIRSYFFANRDSLEIDEEETLVNSTGGDFSMTEDVAAAYLMSTFETGGWRVVYGVRYEDTSFDATGQRIFIDAVNGSGEPEIVPASFDQGYDNFLPSINARFESGNFVFRAAATQTLARPNFNELSPGGEIEFETDDGANEFKAEVGNPLLEPVEATNLDVGVEWYPGGVSVISAGLFYKELENFIVLADVGDAIDLTPFVGNTPVDDAEVIQPINGDKAELLGVELAFVQQFDNGFYVSGNSTYVDSEASYAERTGKTVLPRTPELVLNGAVGWENSWLSLRLAATYRDDALQEFGELDDPEFDIYQDEHLQVDLSGKWNVTPRLQISAAIINLTDEPYYNYFGSRQFNAQYEEYGRTFSLGLRYTPL
jgi:TonB-dependent receptor